MKQIDLEFERSAVNTETPVASDAKIVDPKASPPLLEVEPAKNDPFNAKIRVIHSAAPAAEPLLARVVEPTAVAAAPPLEYQYFGRMTLPDGKQITMLSKGGQPLTVEEGTMLDNGYVVVAVEPTQVRLSYPATNTTIELAVPASPSLAR